jgi:hypothetical protein
LVALLALAGCATLPTAAELRDTVAAYPGGTLPADRDGRARFREIFCQLTAPAAGPMGEETVCGALLWMLGDEPGPSGPPLPLPELDPALRVLVVSGAFGDCRTPDTIPFADEIARLASLGMDIRAVVVSGRSGAAHNARQIAEVVEGTRAAAGDRLVLVGYSKGAVDILQFLVDFPVLAQQVAAVVSVAGPIFGSPLAASADGWYRSLFAGAFAGTCDPGDGGVIHSLLPETRRQWLEDHSLPAHVAYYSLAGFTTADHLGRGLQPTWRLLARHDRRNDGQVVVADAAIPGSTLLGYANADHWDMAIAVERQLPYLSARRSPRSFPRSALLDATLRYVAESLESEARTAP